MAALPYIPGHTLIQRLGGGPMTVVYSARERAEDRPCAVKLIRDGWDDEATAIKLLQREARAGLSVRHPHLVRFLNAHVTRAPYFLVMELLPGESLRRRLRRDYRLEPAAALWIVRQSTEALAALHRRGFVHGDIKPENIRLTDQGTAKLIDLGFAHRPGENAALMKQGYVLGTANYLAPELCRFEHDADQQSDIYSLGILFFELLAGQLPYPSGSIAETFARHCDEEPASLRELAPGLSPGLYTLVDRLLARDPKKRPKAAAVVAQLVALEIDTLGRRRSA
ncbi:MAG: serine/threonine-protein kinase [Gemmataceae bacterium]